MMGTVKFKQFSKRDKRKDQCNWSQAASNVRGRFVPMTKFSSRNIPENYVVRNRNANNWKQSLTINNNYYIVLSLHHVKDYILMLHFLLMGTHHTLVHITVF